VYPAPVDLATFALILGVGLPAAYLFSRALKLRPQRLDFINGTREAWLAVVVFVAVFGTAFGIYGFYDRVWVRATLTADPLYVIRGAIAAAVILVPVAIALLATKQSLKSVGISRNSLGKGLALGLLVSLVLVLAIGVLSPHLGGGFVGFSVPMGYQLLAFAVAGFSEEIVFRGYIQTRLEVKAGWPTAVALGAAFYAAYNFVLGFFCFSGNLELAAVYGALRFAPGIVYGYVFHRSGNIVSCGVLHTLLTWGGLLFGLYL
jgi:membrane protease YdiL (CAAX protease family)